MSKKKNNNQPPPPSESSAVLSLELRLQNLVGHHILEGLSYEPEERLRNFVQGALDRLEEAERTALDEGIPDAVETASGEVVDRARSLLGTHALAAVTGADLGALRERIGGLPQDTQQQLFTAGLQHQIGVPTEAGTGLIQTHLGDPQPAVEEMNPMVQIGFYSVDKTNLPANFDDAAFVQAVTNAVKGMGVDPAANEVLVDAIVGMLLLDGNTDPTTSTFATQISGRLWTYLQSPLLDSNSQQVNNLRNRDVFVNVDGDLENSIRKDGHAFYQELAYAGRQIIDGNRGGIVTNDILRQSAVQAALQSYGSGTSSQGSFDLPPLTGPTAGGGTDEIIPDHIRSVAMHYAALQLEIVGLFKVVDRNVEIFMNGQLPVNADSGGNALNAYYWDTINRMSESARWMQYTRILGAKGGEVSKEVQPNTAFDDMFMRFLSAISEYDRQQRVADLLGNQRSLALTAEHVRKAGRDLAANSTLQGYGYSQFSAKKLMLHIQTALNILKLSDVQSAWGVQSAWQVVERVSAQEFKANPNVVKYRTMAESGKRIIDLVAAFPDAWTGNSGNPLFQDPTNADAPYDIDPQSQQQFIRNTEFWLAVNGVKDQDVVQGSQPADTAAAPSIPTLDGTGAGNGHSTDISAQLQQMLNQGQTPTPDQLRKLVGI